MGYRKARKAIGLTAKEGRKAIRQGLGKLGRLG